MAQAGIKLSAESLKFIQGLKAMGNPGYVDRQIVSFFTREGAEIGGRIANNTSAGGNGLRRRTGSLARSIWGDGIMYHGVPGIRVGSLRGPAVKYVKIQELGTVGKGGELPTIKPQGTMVKNLAIPLNQALTPSGVPRKPSPMNWGKLHFIPFKNRKSQNAQGALFTPAEFKKIQRAIKRGTFEGLKNYKALYLLVRKVDIKPKHFLRNGLMEAIPDLNRKLAAFIKSLWFAAGARGGRVS